MVVQLPDETTRWRCGHCGNLTRFDVERRRHSRQYWHVDLGGVPTVEEEVVLTDDIVAVRCRWCGSADAVALVPRPESGTDTDDGPGGTP